MPLPRSLSCFLDEAQQFRARSLALKTRHPLAGNGWYPYDSLSSLGLIAQLIARRHAEIMQAAEERGILDLGCGDGDYALLFGRWGASVDAIDYSPHNFNGMQGVRRAREVHGVPIGIHDMDVDTVAAFPREQYGLTLFLGALYHLKNPYGVLEHLAYRTDWCLLSTRVARMTPDHRVRVADHPLAYLAGGAEIENDATNYWVFSPHGLERILQRTRWAIASAIFAGDGETSNPVDRNADERAFFLLKSRVKYPMLQASPGEGWHSPENGYRWTAKRFAIDVVLPLETPVKEARLEIEIPEAIVRDGQTIELRCRVNGRDLGRAVYGAPGRSRFICGLPEFAAHEPRLRLDFDVLSPFSAAADRRELGICIPATGSPDTEGIPLSVT